MVVVYVVLVRRIVRTIGGAVLVGAKEIHAGAGMPVVLAITGIRLQRGIMEEAHG